MKEEHPRSGWNEVTISRCLAILAATICGMLSSGCFVVTSNHVSKPVAPRESVALRHEENGDDTTGWYVRSFYSPDVDFDISVHNNAERLQVGFLFWVIPIPFSKTGIPDADIEADIRPKKSGVVIDPWRIQYIPVNGISTAPVKVSRSDVHSWKPVAHGQLAVDKPESFRLEYNVPCNPDLSFKLSVGGISIPGQTNFVTTILYKPAKIVRAGFRLPY